ncbi:uncharacterized protein LY79DRAFT_533708 [Colletotrichum navitas]|uniref:ATP phosphoribosyltransferase n=1 Tax=Colletotrichum navitas TaxID=681940 RepID=A0AAD8QD80_9PEZI|nr:uncharacterized protein LY79DRAFT_533708 [Colletotrichum navitas]KAK1600472.1 hypothetical protein LY79DRAFT_533708 [Colletotrichum navitas]
MGIPHLIPSAAIMPAQSSTLGIILLFNCTLYRPRAFPLSRLSFSKPYCQVPTDSKSSLRILTHRYLSSVAKMADRYKLIYTVPASHLVATKDAVFKTGAGVYDEGKYVQVAFELTGQGQFMPVAAAGVDPHAGTVDQLERVLEYRVEILCAGRDIAKAAVVALKSTHPYEVPAYEVYKLEDM